MNFFWPIILGIVQGFTEFLPVSSSGHLVILQNFLPGFNQPGILLDVFLHLGTAFAVIYFFRKEIVSLVKEYWFFLFVGTLPAGIVGILLQEKIESLFVNLKLVGLALLVTAFFNLLSDQIKSLNNKIKVKSSLIIGLFQAVAIVPGVSRSGATIFAGILSGLGKENSARFSFLLSLPAIFGANILELNHLQNYSLDLTVYLAGFFSALISGLVSIKIVLRSLEKKNFRIFGFYCLILAIVVFLI